MLIIKKLKKTIKSNGYKLSNIGLYYNDFLTYNKLTRIDFDYYMYNNILFCHIPFCINKKIIKTINLLIKLKC